MQKDDRITSAGTAADSDMQLIVTTSASIEARPVLAAVPYQCCPRCEGQGIVSKPDYVAQGVDNWSSTSAVHQCSVCNGQKIIPMFPVNSNAFIITKGDEVNCILSAALRCLDAEQLVVLRDKIIRRTPQNGS